MYSASQVAQLFKTARETIRNWAIEFKDELEPNANPGEGRQRSFSDRDLEVIALISEMKGQGKLYADIHAALANGQRGDVPADVSAIVPTDTPRPTQLQARVNFLEAELQTARETDQRNQAQIELLTRQLEAAQQEIKSLNREIGRLEANITPPKES